MPKDGALKQPGSEVTSGGEGGVSRGSLCPELMAVQEGVGVATSLAWRALYTTLQGPNKCGNLLRKGLSGPPLALRSEDLWDKTSIHHEPCRGPVNSHPNGNRTQQDSVAASLPSRQPCSPGAAKGRAGPQGGVGGGRGGEGCSLFPSRPEAPRTLRESEPDGPWNSRPPPSGTPRLGHCMALAGPGLETRQVDSGEDRTRPDCGQRSSSGSLFPMCCDLGQDSHLAKGYVFIYKTKRRNFSPYRVVRSNEAGKAKQKKQKETHKKTLLEKHTLFCICEKGRCLGQCPIDIEFKPHL